MTSGLLQPDGCKLSVLLTFSFIKQKRAIFSVFYCLMLLVISCQHIINNNLMKFKLTFPSNDVFQAHDCVFMAVTLITSKSMKHSDAIQRYSSNAPQCWSKVGNEHVNCNCVGVDTTSHVYGISL